VDFFIDQRSSVAQIEEQIKLAVAMGVFQNNGRLPSIREIEKQTGANRGKIYRAYRSLKQSGLVVSTGRGGTVISAPPLSARAINQKCLQLSMSTIRKARRYGIPPMVFARYLGGQAQEMERSEPFIAFVDDVNEVAERRAEEIARLWQVSVVSMTVQQLQDALRRGRVPRKILANHLRHSFVRSLVSRKTIDVIPIEVVYSEQTRRELAKIKANSCVLRILAVLYIQNAPFIIAQLLRWVRAPGVKISWISVQNLSKIKQLLNGSKYDRVIVDPGVLNSIPKTLLQNRHLLQVRLQLHPPSLEAARIRAGVIV
jgi:DNA-binding transcriptional regulator YhcF (GntR family)